MFFHRNIKLRIFFKSTVIENIDIYIYITYSGCVAWSPCACQTTRVGAVHEKCSSSWAASVKQEVPSLTEN